MLRRALKQAVTSCLPSRWVLYRVPRAGNKVALTFDDGPNPEYTARVSRLLREQGARATFFLVGERMRRYPDLVARLLADGHELGNHSMTHAEFARLGYREIVAETEEPWALADAHGRRWFANRYFRPPKGVLNAKVLAHCVRRGRRIVLWSADPKDYRAASACEVLAYFDAHPVRPGDIVLLHDKTAATVEALPELLSRLKVDGLVPVTLSALLGVSGEAEA